MSVAAGIASTKRQQRNKKYNACDWLRWYKFLLRGWLEPRYHATVSSIGFYGAQAVLTQAAGHQSQGAEGTASPEGRQGTLVGGSRGEELQELLAYPEARRAWGVLRYRRDHLQTTLNGCRM